MRKSRFSDSQIMNILREAQNGASVAEVCRTHNISNALFYRWRSKYGGLDASMISELKSLQAEVQLQKEILQEAMRKKW